MKSVFLDTNIYMHCKPADQIDWGKVISDDEVEIVVPRVVIGELDNHKNGHPDIKLRHRARERAEQLKGWLRGGGRVREGTTVKRFKLSPAFDFQEHDLDKSKPDDELIASILEYRAKHPSTEAVLVTHDVGPQLTADDFGIRTVELPERYKLKVEIDPVEKENQRLRQRVQRLENALPKLSLAFATENGFQDWVEVKVEEERPLAGRALEERLAGQKAKYPPLDLPEPRRNTPLANEQDTPLSRQLRDVEGLLEATFPRYAKTTFSSQEIEDYNRKLENYYQEYKNYLATTQPFRKMRGLTVAVDFIMLNEGAKPGEDIDVHMHLPGGFTPFAEYTLPKPPEPPTPPPKPKTELEKLVALTSPRVPEYMLRGPDFLPGKSAPSNVSGLSIKKTNSHDVKFHVARVKHGTHERVARLFFVFNRFETASHFTIEYQLNPANLPEPVSGELHVKVIKGANRER